MAKVVKSIVNRNPGVMNPVGVVIHNDAGTLTGVGYKNFLANHPLENGFAHYYVSEGSILLAQYTDRIAWHTGNQWGNANLIGFEVCQSMSASDAQFLRNEEETFRLAAEVMKSYNIPINEKTVWLHKELSPTACPHRSWDLHGKSIASVKKYFVERIRYYANGGEAPVKAATVKKAPAKNTGGWQVNKYGKKWKNEKGTFINGSEPIQAYYVGPFVISKNKAGRLPAKASVKYDKVMVQDGYVWIGYNANDGKRIYLPIRKHKNGVDGPLWGTIK
ncbi:SH3 domain-containing protein [Macrococcus armenti]|uniref:SH3 domain-containing protein n=1 Tax=Macrococcus armenti TaxID=2875764 RepID=UPI001CD7480E|nr:SH3 domain-containing protein [Macrococcus armenti]UBH10065.1 SH3 domain-containing protein [Macrococcus armenti]